MNDMSEHDMTTEHDLTNETDPEMEPEVKHDHSGRHPVNIGHLVMGIAFMGLSMIWLLFETEAVQGDDLRWLLPLPWLAAGLAGLIGIGLTGRRSRPDQR